MRPQATEAELQALPANVIVRALGMREGIEIDRLVVKTCPGDVFLLCTDGVTEHLDREAIAAILQRHGDPSMAVRAMLDAVAASWPPSTSRDNATALVHVVASG